MHSHVVTVMAIIKPGFIIIMKVDKCFPTLFAIIVSFWFEMMQD